MSDRTIFVAKDSVLGEFEGRPLYIHQGVTTVRAGHPLLAAFGGLFVPLEPMFDVADEGGAVHAPQSETAATPEVVPEPTPEPAPEPEPKAVRAWAAEQGIEVPTRGKLPADLVEKYQAAQGV